MREFMNDLLQKIENSHNGAPRRVQTQHTSKPVPFLITKAKVKLPEGVHKPDVDKHPKIIELFQNKTLLNTQVLDGQLICRVVNAHALKVLKCQVSVIFNELEKALNRGEKSISTSIPCQLVGMADHHLAEALNLSWPDSEKRNRLNFQYDHEKNKAVSSYKRESNAA